MDAIAVKTGSRPYFDPKNRMPDPEEISKCCSSLVVIVTIEENQSGEDRKEIQLAHFSVKKYLTSTRLKKDIATDLQETTARASIAEVCLIYLLELNATLPVMEIRKSFFLAQYSARYWVGHAKVAESHSETVRTLAKKFFSHKMFYETCYHLYDADRPWEYNELAPALYYASLWGLASSVQALLKKNADVNAQGNFYNQTDYRNEKDITLLYAASCGGYEKVVQMLLEKNADINAQGGGYGNALQAALSEGHKKVV